MSCRWIPARSEVDRATARGELARCARPRGASTRAADRRGPARRPPELGLEPRGHRPGHPGARRVTWRPSRPASSTRCPRGRSPSATCAPTPGARPRPDAAARASAPSTRARRRRLRTAGRRAHERAPQPAGAGRRWRRRWSSALIGWNIARARRWPHRAAAPRRPPPRSPPAPTPAGRPVHASARRCRRRPKPPRPPPYVTPGRRHRRAGRRRRRRAGRQRQAAAGPTPFVAAGRGLWRRRRRLAADHPGRKPISLVVRGPAASVYFARQLAAGEAYRAPALPGLTAEVSDPAAVEVFVGRRLQGAASPSRRLPLAKLGG